MITNHIGSLTRLLMHRARVYFGSPVGEFFCIGTNRLMLYSFMVVVILAECFIYWLLRHGVDFMLNHMAFTTILSLHKALLFAFCFFGMDILADRLAPGWGAYLKRTVGHQWIIWAIGFIIGVLLLKSLVIRCVEYYAPEVFFYLKANPEKRAGLFEILTILLPIWSAAVFVALQVARSKDQMKRLTGAMFMLPEESDPGTLSFPSPELKHPEGALKMNQKNGNGIINLADITHITVEDHYCRINYSTEKGLKNEMIRLPLKEMMQRLPNDFFIQIHRSHVVNVGHISHLAKEGREHKVVLRLFAVELPVSRHRFKHLEPRLKTVLESNPQIN